MKDIVMKSNTIRTIKTGLIACAALALVFTANAAEQMKPMKSGEHLLMLNKIETKAQSDALKPDDTMAMVCAKCKTVYITRVKQGVKGAQILQEGGQPKELIGTHACVGCKSTLTVVAHRKGDVTELKHSCKACGDDSAFCCATKGGSAAMKEMEKEIK